MLARIASGRKEQRRSGTDVLSAAGAPVDRSRLQQGGGKTGLAGRHERHAIEREERPGERVKTEGVAFLQHDAGGLAPDLDDVGFGRDSPPAGADRRPCFLKLFSEATGGSADSDEAATGGGWKQGHIRSLSPSERWRRPLAQAMTDVAKVRPASGKDRMQIASSLEEPDCAMQSRVIPSSARDLSTAIVQRSLAALGMTPNPKNQLGLSRLKTPLSSS